MSEFSQRASRKKNLKKLSTIWDICRKSLLPVNNNLFPTTNHRKGTLKMDDFDPPSDGVNEEFDGPESDRREARFMAEFGLLYLESIAGLRSPQQLSRWLGDQSFLALHDARVRQARAREFLGMGEVAPKITIEKVAFFPGARDKRTCVVLFKWSGMRRALSISKQRIGQSRTYFNVDIIGA